jgi:hypothetical protein
MAQLSEDIALYEQQAKSGSVDPYPYDRLMIYYRKRKEFKKELQLINHALQVFSDRLKKQAGKMLETARSQASIKKLSAKFSKSAGLVDKKGNPTYVPEPLLRWTKRKKTVQEKLKKMS